MESYINNIKVISKIGLPILLPETRLQLKGLEGKAVETIKIQEHVKIPIMGLFNAGKTSLINALIGCPGLLPVDIVQTTAIPCEIYSAKDSTSQKAEIFRAGELVYDGSIEGYGLFEIIPGDVGKVYVDSPFIKSCEDKGIILVDMPGTDSGIREHNEAILRYVKNGTIFALLSNVSNGALSAVETAFLKELVQYGLPCALFLTQKERIDKDSLSEVSEVFSLSFHSIMGEDAMMGVISSNKSELDDFKKWIDNIDVAKINCMRFTPIVNKYLMSVLNSVETYRNVIKSSFDFNDIDSQIDALEQQLKEIERVLNDSIENADSPEKSTQDILDVVSNSMISNARLVAEAIVSESSAQVNDTIMSIIRPALIKAFAEEREQFVNAMKTELDAVTNHLLGSLEIPSDVISNLITDNSDAIIGFLQRWADSLMESDNPYAKIAGQILNVLAEHVPSFLNKILGGKERALKKVEQKFVGPFTSQIISSLRPVVLRQVKEQQQHILENVRMKYAQQVAQIKEALRHLHEERTSGEAEFNGQIKEFEDVISKLNNIKKSLD